MEVFKKMERAMKDVKGYKEDLDLDKAELLRSGSGQEYFWLTRRNGTCLLPVAETLIRDNYSNVIAKHYALEEDTRAYLLTLSLDEEGNLVGSMKRQKNFYQCVVEKETTPVVITASFLSKDGEQRSETIPFVKNYFVAFMEKMGWDMENVQSYRVESYIA